MTVSSVSSIIIGLYHETVVIKKFSEDVSSIPKPMAFTSLQNDTLEKAAQTLLDDYSADKELTAFISLDGEDFYA